MPLRHAAIGHAAAAITPHYCRFHYSPPLTLLTLTFSPDAMLYAMPLLIIS
jgi:hypothetical protein